jgi:hypothetical protein
LEILDESKYKQNKSDKITRKERLALRELTQNQNLVINKADKGSTIVVEDRDEYISNAMEHLNDDISNDLKQNIIKKLDLLFRNGLMKRNWVDFCQAPNQTRTPRLLFLKENSQKSDGNPTHRIQLQ